MISQRYRLLDEISGRRRSFPPVRAQKKKISFLSFLFSLSFFFFSGFVKTNGIGARDRAVPQLLNKDRIKRLKRNINIIIRREGRRGITRRCCSDLTRIARFITTKIVSSIAFALSNHLQHSTIIDYYCYYYS